MMIIEPAAEGGRGACVTLLIDAGADLNIASSSGRTPLHGARRYPSSTSNRMIMRLFEDEEIYYYTV